MLQSRLLTDPDHPVFNAIVGRYANRLKNGLLQLPHIIWIFINSYEGTFSIPITKEAQPPGPNVYQIPTNDHNGEHFTHECEMKKY